MAKPNRVYLDYSATTPLSKAAFSEMLPYFSDRFGNADSPHGFGNEAAYALDCSRREVAHCFSAEASEIFFTSGGTEANNWAVKGTARANRKANQKTHMILSAIEHASVAQSARRLQQEGFTVTTLPVNHAGLVSPEDLTAAIRPETGLISVMLANNEIGSVQPIPTLAAIAKKHGIPFHCDAVAAAGMMEIDAGALGVDLLTVSAHKIYGPKGAGVLYIRKGLNVRPEPLLDGGQQERQRRGGTVNVAAAVGLKAALLSATAQLKQNYKAVKAMRDGFVAELKAKVSDLIVNGDAAHSLPHIANLSFLGVGSAEAVAALDLAGVACSAGAACSSGSAERSPVLKAIGLSEKAARSAIRFSFSHLTTKEELDFAIEKITTVIKKIRSALE